MCGFIGVRWRRVGNPTKTKAKISPMFHTFTGLLRLNELSVDLGVQRRETRAADNLRTNERQTLLFYRYRFYKSFLWGNLGFGGCFEKPSLQALFWCKKLRSRQKIGKVTKRRRSVKPTCANGGTNRASGGTNASFCTSGDFQFFLARGQIKFEFDSVTVKREKKRKNEGKKDCGQRQREEISLIFRRASSLEKEIDGCLHLVRRISHAVDVAVHV